MPTPIKKDFFALMLRSCFVRRKALQPVLMHFPEPRPARSKISLDSLPECRPQAHAFMAVPIQCSDELHQQLKPQESHNCALFLPSQREVAPLGMPWQQAHGVYNPVELVCDHCGSTGTSLGVLRLLGVASQTTLKWPVSMISWQS